METANLCHANKAQVITTQDLPDTIVEMIQQQIARLKREYSYLLDCRVSITVPAFYHAGTYQVQLVLNLPDLELVIDREPIPDYYQEDMYVAIWSAFDLARKKLKSHSIPTNYDTLIMPIQQNSDLAIRGIRRSWGYARG
jgi:ribosome-associated translation inhibitor RaiA